MLIYDSSYMSSSSWFYENGKGETKVIGLLGSERSHDNYKKSPRIVYIFEMFKGLISSWGGEKK